MAQYLREGKQLFAASLLVALLCAGCDSDNTVQQTEKSESQAKAIQASVAVVGNSRLQAKDVAYRQSIALAYGNAVEPQAALIGLVNDMIEAEVGRLVGVSPTSDELRSFSDTVEKNSKAPEVLAAVKKVFGNDMGAYQQTYLAPKVLNRKLHYWFSRSEKIHKQQRDAIQQAWTLVQNGSGFEQAAKETGLNYSQQKYGGKKREMPGALKGVFQGSMPEMNEPFRKFLDAISPGAIAETITEDDHSYRIVRLVDKNEAVYNTEEISVAKASFASWFSQQAEKIDIRIHDDSVRQLIQRDYANIPWVQRL